MNEPMSEHFAQVLRANSPERLWLLAAAVSIWVVGANLVLAWHYRRQGKSLWNVLNPLSFPFKSLNQNEWLSLAALAAAFLVVSRLALSY